MDHHDADGETFVSELISPEPGTGDTAAMASGAPGLPTHFTWRGTKYRIIGVRRQWKTSEAEGGTGRLYLRRHWYTVATDGGLEMTLYCQRQAGSRRQAKSRWWLYTVRPLPHDDEAT